MLEKKPLEFTEIESFLDNSNKKININIVYYHSLLKEVFKNNVFSKKVSSECDILFTKLGNYYYIYNNLEILWKPTGSHLDTDTTRENIKTRLVDHISIGYDRRGWNIHENVYSPLKSYMIHDNQSIYENFYYIVKRKYEIYYNINQIDQTLLHCIDGDTSKLNIKSIWNELLYGINNNFNENSNFISIDNDTKIKPSNGNEVINSIKNLKLKKENLAIYRTDINKKIIFQNKVIEAAKNKNVLFIHDKNFTYIIINIHYEPKDIEEYIEPEDNLYLTRR